MAFFCLFILYFVFVERKKQFKFVWPHWAGTWVRKNQEIHQLNLTWLLTSYAIFIKKEEEIKTMIVSNRNCKTLFCAEQVDSLLRHLIFCHLTSLSPEIIFRQFYFLNINNFVRKIECLHIDNTYFFVFEYYQFILSDKS